MNRTRTLAALAVAGLALTACSPAADTATEASASASGITCDKATLETKTPGKLVIATGQPAYEPWVKDDAPESGEGFEAAVAYAAAEKLGYDPADVQWTRTTFDVAIAPGAKDFDWNLQQFSITEDREKAVDFSSSYYDVNQAIVSYEGSPIADAKTLADLESAKLGAAVGSTSLDAAQQLATGEEVAVFNDNAAAVSALKNEQIDGLVVDLPTAFYLVAAELDEGVIVGQLPAAEGATTDQFGILLPNNSALTSAPPRPSTSSAPTGPSTRSSRPGWARTRAHPPSSSAAVSQPGGPPRPSAEELRRRAVRAKQARRSTAIATVSSVLVIGALVAVVVSSPGWDVVRSTFFDLQYALEVLPAVFAGLLLNIRLTIVATVLIAILGLALALARTSKAPALAPFRILATGYVDLFRGVPTLLVILLIGFGVPALGLTGVTSSVVVLGTAAIVLTYSAYVAEVLRSGILSVHPSQGAAARSLGLTSGPGAALRHPPAGCPSGLPPLMNDFVSLLKDTGLISVLGVVDAIRAAQIESSRTFNYTPYVVAAVLFLILPSP